MCLLFEMFSQVSDVAHGPLVFKKCQPIVFGLKTMEFIEELVMFNTNHFDLGTTILICNKY